MSIPVYSGKKVATRLVLDTTNFSAEYLVEGWHVYDTTLLPTKAGFWVLVAHGWPDGTLPLARTVRKFLAAHPDKKIYLACCHGAKVAAKNPDLAPYILPELADNTQPAWFVSVHGPGYEAVDIEVLNRIN